MKTKEPKLKRLGVKGMSNMKYLGHFAQDKYMHKGHNLSGVYDFSSAIFGDRSQRERLLSDIQSDPATEKGNPQYNNITEAASSGPTQKVKVVAPGYETSSAADAQYIEMQRPLTADEQYLKREADLNTDRARRVKGESVQDYMGLDVNEGSGNDTFANRAKYSSAAYASRNDIENKNFISNIYANRYRR